MKPSGRGQDALPRLSNVFIPQGHNAHSAFCLIALLTGLSLGFAADVPSPAHDETNAPIQVAFSGGMFTEVNENDAAAAVRVWAQMLGTEHGIPVDPAVKIISGTASLRSALRTGTADVITMPTDDFWAIRNDIRAGSFVYGMRSGKATEEYVLLVHRDSSLNDINSLRGRTLAIFQNPRASLAVPWLESLLATNGAARMAEFFGRTSRSSRLTRAMLPVFFRQCDACLVTRAGFETASELNPQLGKQLRAIAGSPAVIPVVCFFREDYHSPFRQKLLTQIKRVNSTPAGQQFMNLFQCDTLQEGSESELEGAMRLLDAQAGAGRSVGTVANHAPGETAADEPK